MSKFYVGGTFTRYAEVRSIIDACTAAGHEVTYDWTRTNEFGEDGELLPARGDGYQKHDDWAEKAQHEVDACVAVAHPDNPGGFAIFLGQQASLGWPVELGMLIMAADLFSTRPRVLVVDAFKTTVFMAMPVIEEHKTVEQALQSLGVEGTADVQ